MSEDRNTAPTGRSGVEPAPERSSSWWPTVAPALALAVGLLIGGVVVGVAKDGGSPSADEQTTTSPVSGNSTTPSSDAPTTVVVPAECLAVADTVDQLTNLTRQGADAISNFDADALRNLLTKLENLDRQARRQAQACRDVKVGKSSG